MGIFNLFRKKENKQMANLDEMLRSLSDSEKKELHAKLQDLYKAEDEREIDKIEREKADNSEKKDEKYSEEKQESKEIGKDVDELEDKIKKEKQDSRDDKQEEKAKDHSEEIAELKAMFRELNDKVEKAMGNKLDNAREKYGLSSKGGTESAKEKFTDEDVNKLLG